MHTTINLELGTRPIPCRGPHCTPEQARELLEGLRTAYQSLLPAERNVIRDIVAQSERTQFTQEMNARKGRLRGRVLKADDNPAERRGANGESTHENGGSQRGQPEISRVDGLTVASGEAGHI